MAFVAKSVVVESPRAVADPLRDAGYLRRVDSSRVLRDQTVSRTVSASRSRRGREGVSRPALADRLGQKTEEARSGGCGRPLPSKETAESIIEGDACPVNKDFVCGTLCKEARERRNGARAGELSLLHHLVAQVAEDASRCPRERSEQRPLDSQLLEMFSAQNAGMGCL